MIFCGQCGTKNGFPMSSIRTARGPCEVCGGYDQIQQRARGGGVITRNMNNYSYPTSLLPSVVEAEEAQEVERSRA
jgi:hypothetical protein